MVGTPASAQALPDADRQLQSVCELLPPWLLPVAPPRSPCPGGAFALQLWAIGCMWWAHQPDMLVLWMLVGNCRDFCFRVCPFGGMRMLTICECACSATSKFCGLLLPNVGSATSISLPWRSCCSAVVGHRVHVVGAPASAQALPDADRQLQSVCELLPPWLLPVAPPRSPCPGGAFALQLWAIGCMWWAHQPDMLVLWMLVGNCRDFCFRVCSFNENRLEWVGFLLVRALH